MMTVVETCRVTYKNNICNALDKKAFLSAI